MEAREFFKGSRMHEITVSATPNEWREILSAAHYAYWADEAGTATAELMAQLEGLGVKL